MNPYRLLTHYDRIADAPDAIPRLRRFILNLAVRGKLVPQDPTDEPASDLVKRIAAEKNGSRAKSVKRADPNERFGVPEGWAPSTLGVVANVVMGQSPPGDTYNKDGEGVPLINGPVEFSAGPFGVTTVNQYTTAPTTFCQKGDLLICVRGSTTGRTNIAGFRACIGRGVAAIQPHFDDGYLRLFIWKSRESIIGMGRGIAFPSISRQQIEDLVVPLPPLPEQHRIVAKVDELMALCDRLDAARTDRETTRDRLAASSLARLNTPDPATFPADARFALAALPALTTRPDQITHLRQTILNLAVRGKLVPQDPTDEPASLPIADCDKSMTDLPATWRYTRLTNLLAEDTRNGYSRRPDEAPDGTPILRISAGTLRRDGIVAEEEHKLISGITAVEKVQYGLRPGDLLACRFNGNKSFVGRLTIFNDYLQILPIYPDKLIRVRVMPELAVPSYLQKAGDSDIVRNDIEDACATTVGNWGISASTLKQIRFPLPPLAEQHRIVAKVDELMALCDQLEASLTDAAATRRRLLDALLAESLEPGLTS